MNQLQNFYQLVLDGGHPYLFSKDCPELAWQEDFFIKNGRFEIKEISKTTILIWIPPGFNEIHNSEISPKICFEIGPRRIAVYEPRTILEESNVLGPLFTEKIYSIKDAKDDFRKMVIENLFQNIESLKSALQDLFPGIGIYFGS